MVVLTFSTTVFTTKSIIAVTMNYTTFDITNEKMFKMTKGRSPKKKVATYFLTMAANQRCEWRTSLSLRVFSV